MIIFLFLHLCLIIFCLYIELNFFSKKNIINIKATQTSNELIIFEMVWSKYESLAGEHKHTHTQFETV